MTKCQAQTEFPLLVCNHYSSSNRIPTASVPSLLKLKQNSHCYFLTHQVVLGLGHVCVIRPEAAFVNVQGSLIVVLNFLVLPLVLTQQCQIVELLGHVWVLCS